MNFSFSLLRRWIRSSPAQVQPEKKDEAPDNPMVAALLQHQQGNLEPAKRFYMAILKKQPDNADVTDLVGMIAYRQGDYDAAEKYIHRAMTLDPERAVYHAHLGHVMAARGQLDKAAACYRAALVLKPYYLAARDNLGEVLRRSHVLPEAFDVYLKGMNYATQDGTLLDHMIQNARNLCLWEQYERVLARLEQVTREQLMRGAPCSLSPAHALFVCTNPEMALEVARNYVVTQLQTYRILGEKSGFSFIRPLKEKMRLGYVSSHFHGWATGARMRGLLAHHDRAIFEIYIYNTAPKKRSDPLLEIFRAQADHYTDIGALPPAQGARIIYEDHIDILIDLSGYFAGSRPEIFAIRPAPIQVRYTDFAGTSGGAFMDYLVTDRVIAPQGQEAFFSEKQMVLPHSCFMGVSTADLSESVPARAECGVSEKSTVLCCFVKPFVMEPKLFGMWLGLLSELPDTVLWLYGASEVVEENLRHEARIREISPERLVFSRERSYESHRTLLAHADLFLDSTFSSRQMAVEALCAGVPVLTFYGNTIASRLTASILHAAGLDDLVARNFPEYRRLVLSYAGDKASIRMLKQRVKERLATTPLLDARRHVNAFEKGLCMAVARHRKGLSPDHIHVAAS